MGHAGLLAFCLAGIGPLAGLALQRAMAPHGGEEGAALSAPQDGISCRFRYWGSHEGESSWGGQIVAVNASNLVHASGNVRVVDIGRDRVLTTVHSPDEEGATCEEHSFVRLDGQEALYNYLRAMISGILKVHRGPLSRAAVLGTGGGNVPKWFMDHMPHVEMDMVDLNEHVIGALQYFGIHTTPTHRTTVADGRAFLEGAPDQSYDLIVIDVMGEHHLVPPCFTTVEFFQTVRAKLAPGGVMAMDSVMGLGGRSDLLSSLGQAFQAEVLVVASPGLSNTAVVVRAPGSIANSTSATEQAALRRITSRWADEARFTTWLPGQKWGRRMPAAPWHDAEHCS